MVLNGTKVWRTPTEAVPKGDAKSIPVMGFGVQFGTEGRVERQEELQAKGMPIE